MPFIRHIQRALTHRYMPVALALIAVLLTMPSLWAGLHADDYIHRMALYEASKCPPDLRVSPLDIFRFIDGNPERTRRLMDLGIMPWWTFEETRLSFWRPLSALTHWLDYSLWPDRPFLMHAQSLLS